jgi:hypothetical protein
MSEISEVKEALDIIKKDVEKYQMMKSNLETQIHSLEIQKEATGRIQAVEMKNQIAQEEARLAIKESKIKEKQETIDFQEKALQERIRTLERRELEMVDVDAKKRELANERSNFFKYKYGIELEMEKAKIIIQEANQKDQELNIKSESLVVREKGIAKQEKYWNDAIGKLEQDIKAFEIERQNVFKPQEAVNE